MTTPIGTKHYSCFFCCLGTKEKEEKESEKIEAKIQDTKSEKFIINDPFHDPLTGLESTREKHHRNLEYFKKLSFKYKTSDDEGTPKTS